MAKILVLMNMYPPHHLGGYELVCSDCVRRWRELGHDVVVLTTTMRLPDVDEPEDSRDVRRELEFYWRDHQILRPSLRERIRVERHNQDVLTRTIDEFRPDVVSVWHMGAMSVNLLTTVAARSLPMVFVVFDDWMTYADKIDPWTRIFERRPAFAQVVSRLTGLPTTPVDIGEIGAFCFISDVTRRTAEERSRWNPKRATVVYAGINGRLFSGVAADDHPWQWRLLCVGRVEERKGVHVAVRALAHLPSEATLRVDGRSDDAYEARLHALAADLGVADRVRFSVADRGRLGDVYSAADVFCFPVMWDEPFGLVPLEAMACGTPVVATGTGGSSEYLIDGTNCIVVPRGDDRALADAVTKLASDAAFRNRLIAGGRTTAEMFDVDRLADVLDLWHRAAADRFKSGTPDDRPSARDEFIARGLLR